MKCTLNDRQILSNIWRCIFLAYFSGSVELFWEKLWYKSLWEEFSRSGSIYFAVRYFLTILCKLKWLILLEKVSHREKVVLRYWKMPKSVSLAKKWPLRYFFTYYVNHLTLILAKKVSQRLNFAYRPRIVRIIKSESHRLLSVVEYLLSYSWRGVRAHACRFLARGSGLVCRSGRGFWRSPVH